jgi:hypothetical protein
MSIKKLFDSADKSRNYLSTTTEKDSFKDVESSENVKKITEKQETFTPQVDYSKPERFVRYGSAYLYYKGAVEHIYDYYPYDGSDAEINDYHNNLLDIEKYIFDNLYPRTNGHALLSADGWGSLSGTKSGGYGTPSSLEYITFYGGPHTSSYTKLAEAFPSDLNSKRDASNIYDTSIYTTEGLPSDYASGTRQSNLKSNFDTGVTVEFWLKKAAFNNSLTEKEVVFDMWNNGASGSAAYGRLRVELTGASSGSPFLITAQSASSGISHQSIGQNLTTASLGTFSHYAVAFYNSGSNLVTELYVNGELNDTNITAGSLNELNSSGMSGRIGALLTASVDGGNVRGATGAGKLSGSIDEFRFWKARRNAEEIGLNWKAQVRGGTNTDINNTTLGIYYKFNEGITGDTSTDNSVLDYSGRISNGTWTGYDTYSRSTASAFVEAGARTSEYLDPIIYSTHPSVSSLRTDLLAKGEHFDLNNHVSIVNTLPSWMSDDITEKTNDLFLLSHIVGTYLDKLYLQIQSVATLKTRTYTSASAKPYPFAEHLPQSLGLYTPELFVDSSVLEKFLNRTEDTFLESDLHDTKNLIYLNLYNSLTGIYKSKGTERAVKNALRCFNIDDRVVKFKTYSNGNLFTLQNNLHNVVENFASINLNKESNLGGVVYQASDSSNSDSFAFISGTYEDNKEDRYGFTIEANTTFPRFERATLNNVNRNFTDVSVFGMLLANTSSASDTTEVSTDPVNFQVYAIRPKDYSKNAYFKLTSSISPNPFPELTSSLFFDVYDDNNWNFSIRLKPSNYPLSDIVTGSSTFTYDLQFEGINAINDVVQNSFLLTASISQAVGANLLKSAKRIYTGARRTNITGALLTKSDILINDVKYWTKYLESTNIQQHLLDPENSGISGSYRNVSALDTNLKSTDVKNLNTLALHWTFDNITGSDASGNLFYVTDMSSGSAEIRNNYGWIGGISGYQYSGYGFGFAASSTDVVKKEYKNVLRFTNPENPISSNMVNVVDDSAKLYDTTQTPPDFFHTIEKSMYNAISEEMLNFFAGVVDFHNIIGEPVNRYRERYKSLEKLREIFFRKVTTTSDVEKFIKYYRWLDDSIAKVVDQLVPVGGNLEADVYNIIESHVLERNKYKTQFPTLEYKEQEPETPIMGINELNYNWKFGHAPISDSQSDNTLWWSERADRSTDVSSGNATINAQRETIRETIDKVNNQPATKLKTSTGTVYSAKVDVLRKRALPYKLSVLKRDVIKGGVNFNDGKDIGITYTAVQPAGPVNTAGAVFVPENVLLAFTTDMSDIAPTSNDVLDPNAKTKRHLKVLFGREYEEGLGYYNMKSSRVFPFNVFSSSVTTGYNAAVVEGTSASIEITNLHNDVYGSDMEKPMQGPFTEYAVGGHQSRHIAINKGSDGKTTRPEAWRIVLGYSSSGGQDGAIGLVGPDYPDDNDYAGYGTSSLYPVANFEKAVYYRDFTAKRPVNIKNILVRTGSTILGNYQHNYQVVHSVGGDANPRAFVDNPPTLPSQITQKPSSTQARSILDVRRADQSHFQFIPDYAVNYLHSNANNKSVIRSKFSAPGGIEVLGQGYGSIRANEYSVYNSINYRNLSVRKPFQSMGSTSEADGIGTTGIRVSDQNGRDFGLVRNLQSHAGRFGRDELVASPGASLEQNAAFHKVNRNRRLLPAQNSAGNLITSSFFDNFYIQHQIPRNDRQYAWITGSLSQGALGDYFRYGGYAPINGPQEGRYSIGVGASRQYVSFFDFVSASDAKVTSSTLFQPTVRLNIYTIDFVDEALDTNGNKFNNLGQSLASANLSYYNTDMITIAQLNQQSDYFNLLMTRRKNTFGYRGVPQTGPSVNPVIRKQRKENFFTITSNDDTITSYTYKPVSVRAKPIELNLTTNNGQNLTLKTSHENLLLYFSDDDTTETISANSYGSFATDKLLASNLTMQGAGLGLYNLNWVYYSETLFPSRENEFTTNATTRVGYNNLFWRDTQSQRIALHNDSIDTNSYSALVRQSSWPLDAPSGFLTRSAAVLSYIGQNNANLLANSNSAGELQNEYTHVHLASSSVLQLFINRNIRVGGLYSRKHMLGGPRSVVSPSGIDIPETGSGFSLTPDFTNPSASFSSVVDKYAGEALWEAGSQAGFIKKSGSAFIFQSQSSEPWFSNYDDYKEDILLVSRGKAIVPEFRISEHVSDYEKDGTDIRDKYDIFEIVGTDKKSSDSDFYIDYSNSEFLRHFTDIEARSGLRGNQVKFTCNATIRFNPYKGFYPAQRTLDLVEQFKDSYGDAVLGNAPSSSPKSDKNGTVRPLAQTLFAPGILYNTIKAGLAVDYPVITSADKFKKELYGTTNQNNLKATWMLTANSSSTTDLYTGGEFWDYRIPFEAIIRPEKYLDNVQLYDMEPHPSASLPTTASLDSSIGVDEVYTKMASNFFAEISDFFLEDSEYTRLESRVVDNNLRIEPGTYGMRVKLRRSMSGSRNYLSESGSAGNNIAYGLKGGRRYNIANSTASVVPRTSFAIPQNPRLLDRADFQESFTLYSRPTAFGPAVAGRPPNNAGASTDVFKTNPVDSANGINPAFTPPYYDGESWLDIVFTPKDNTAYDLDRILSEVNVTSWRFDPGIFVSSGSAITNSDTDYFGTQIIPTYSGNVAGQKDTPYEGKNINYNCMHLTHSINCFGVEKIKRSVDDSFGNQVLSQQGLTSGMKWVIQPKMETPHMNFNNKGSHPISNAAGTLSLPTYSSASVPRGMWHQFGIVEPNASKGVFLEVGDIPTNWLRNHYDVLTNNSIYNNQNASASGSNVHSSMKSLLDIVQFDTTTKKLGKMANNKTIKEAIVAIPYVNKSRTASESSNEASYRTKEFYTITRDKIKAALEFGSADGDSLEVAGESIRNLVNTMKEYVLPPQFDFLNNVDIEPIAMYFFEFEYELDRDDLSYIWQNLAPRDYEQITKQSVSVAHELARNEIMDPEQFLNDENRWMIFKVKQRGQKKYNDVVVSQRGASTRAPERNLGTAADRTNYPVEFNWPYDYVSFVEMIDLEANCLFGQDRDRTSQQQAQTAEQGLENVSTILPD